MEKSNLRDKRRYGIQLLLFGLTCVISALYLFLPDLLTTKSSLMQVRGSVIYSDLVIDEVSSKSRFGLERNNRRATLVFLLDGQSRPFRLVENIGKDYAHLEYKKLLERMKASKQVVVWIKSSDLKTQKPKVFQIDIDNKTHLDFATVKYKNVWIFVFLIFFGLISMAVVLYKGYLNRFKLLVSGGKAPGTKR